MTRSWDADQITALEARKVFDLRGRTALVTGASRGIAATLAAALAANGAEVWANFAAEVDQQAGFPNSMADLVRAVADAGGTLRPVDADLSTAPGVDNLVSELSARSGAIDIVVLSASVQHHADFRDQTRADIDAQVQTNVSNPIALVQAVLPTMLERGYGRVLSIGSVQEVAPSPEMPIYAMTKAAQANWIRTLAVQHAATGVTFNNLAPGLIETDRNAGRRADPERWRDLVRSANPMRRPGTPADLVGAALVLCSPAGAFITGTTVRVDGGAHIPRVG